MVQWACSSPPPSSRSICSTLHTVEIMKEANAAMTPLEKLPEKIQALNSIQAHDLGVTGAMLYQLSYQSHMRGVVSGFCSLCSVDVIVG